MSNRIVHVPAETGWAYWGPGDLYIFLVTGEESGGSYFTMEARIPPGGGPPPHIHHREDEQFCILEGEFTLRVDDKTIRASVGDFVHVPRGTVHSFRNAGKLAARMLVTYSPAGSRSSSRGGSRLQTTAPLLRQHQRKRCLPALKPCW